MHSSPCHDILHTNTIPTDAQFEALREFLDPRRRELAELNKEVHRLARLLAEAKNRRDELQEMISPYVALISPMRRVPDDVLRVIFLHTLPGWRNTALDSDEGPLLLSRVCKCWRELAHTTPRLWASMHLVVARDSAQPAADLEAQMQFWLKRSAAVPLEISMKLSRQYLRREIVLVDPEISLEPSRFLSTLLSAVRRWGTIQLTFSLANDVAALSKLTEDAVPRLKTFDISLHVRSSASTLNFLVTRSLRAFSFRGMYSAFPLTLHWQNLRILRIGLLIHDQSAVLPFPFPFLRDCASLETLSVSVAGYRLVSDPESLHTVHLPNLTTLTLAHHRMSITPDVWDISSAVDRLKLPALYKLDISQAPVDLMSVLQPLSHIECLVVSVHEVTSDYVASVFKMLPVLQRLRIIGEPLVSLPPDLNGPFTRDADFLARFIPEGGGDTLCPALQDLEFTSVENPYANV
ncbi:hypothetical protein C8F01DRAFT_267929 [Mycena amicta]|nr:hypothetical protein C8F01DRAFT_267929 [Mycena amicta]